MSPGELGKKRVCHRKQIVTKEQPVYTTKKNLYIGVIMTETKISKQDVIKFLRSVNIMSLAACHGDKPISTILLFAVDEDLNFYFATRSETYKTKALEVNPNVSMAIWEHKRMLVQVDGKAEKIENLEEVNEVIDMLADSVSRIGNFWPPVVRFNDKGEYAVFRITPHWLRSLDLTNESIREKEDPFTEIDLTK